MYKIAFRDIISINKKNDMIYFVLILHNLKKLQFVKMYLINSTL